MLSHQHNILYISYDGMTDPLGQSQVIPYLKALSQKGFSFSILSFEKPDVFSAQGAIIQEELNAAGIAWYPMMYTKSPPVLSTLYDLWRMWSKARHIVKRKSVQLIHARSYLPAMVARRLQKSTGTPWLFDMRGFWADERVDGGLWRLSNPIYNWVYRYVKKQERLLLQDATHIISLTEAGKTIIQARQDIGAQPKPITVIPTCVDTDRFNPDSIKESTTRSIKTELGIEKQDFVLGYVGSTGTWYLLDEMLAFFKQLANHRQAKFLFVTKDAPETILNRAQKAGIDTTKVIIRAAQYNEVPQLIAVFDAGIFFIKPVFSKAASAPTKMGEILAMGKPIICIDGVGDVGDLVRAYDCGVVLQELQYRTYAQAIQQLGQLVAIAAAKYRQVSLEYFSLNVGVANYKAVYDNVRRILGL